jgi:hypothetical protein
MFNIFIPPACFDNKVNTKLPSFGEALKAESALHSLLNTELKATL